MTRQGLLLPSKLGHILAETPELLHYEAPMGTFLPYKGRFYCWTAISESGEIRLTEEMMKFLRLKPQMQLLFYPQQRHCFYHGGERAVAGKRRRILTVRFRCSEKERQEK